MAVKNTPGGGKDRAAPRTAFKNSWTQPEGAKEAFVFEARVTNVNMKNWTVDCASVFDRRFWGDIQVSSPYMHSSNGEGMYAVPEIGAKCFVCIPSDGPPPFVLAFIMASEKLRTGTETTGFTYGGGRARPKPGDIVLKGRDDNFCILHRGGVLQIGSTALAQRVYVPLGNLITDTSETYNHYNSGGAINWGVRSTAPDEALDTEYRHTFRVYADDKYADVRLAVGKVQIPVPEPAGDAGETLALEQLEIANSEEKPVVFELVVAPGGFDTDAGQPTEGARDATKLRLFFDRAGGAMLRSEAAVDIRVKKDLWIKSDKTLRLKGKDGVLIESGPNSAYLKMTGEASVELGTGGGVVKLNGGTKPVAHVGSMVQITLVAPVNITTSAGPGTILAGAMMQGFVTTGNPTILV
jgi:hypothetical protein